MTGHRTMKQNRRKPGKINVAVAGVGNCASALVEGVCHYRQHPESDAGLLFPTICDYSVRDIEVVCAFDVSALKVGREIRSAIYQAPNNFVRIDGVGVDFRAPVFRAPTLDGNPAHLAKLVPESPLQPVDVVTVLKDFRVDILLNLLPTGSIEATEFYAEAALDAGCAFVNGIPTPLAQRPDFQESYARRALPLFGDDIKSQMGTTILHRALLSLLEMRGSRLRKTSQINVGGNTDFANFIHRSETKLISKRKSLQRYVKDAESHVGHHFDPTNGPLKTAYIDLDCTVFGGSSVKIGVKLQSDDKPNCAGSLVDLIRVAKGALDSGRGGFVPEACAFYMKSPPSEMADAVAFQLLQEKWAGKNDHAGEMAANLGHQAL